MKYQNSTQKVTYKAADSSDYSFDKQNAFGWGTCSDINGTPYQLDGGWHKENPTYTILYASSGDDRQAIMEAIETFDIVVLDGSQGDFVLSEYLLMRNIKNKSILGRNKARLCTQWYITPELRQVLDDANVNQYSTSGGTGGYLSNGKWIDEAREQHTRQVIIDFTGDETEVYRNAGIFKLDSSDENIIIRNLTLVGPGSVDVGGTDIISNYGATNVWIDHCDFMDGMDGNFDITRLSDFITVSWCTFSYNERSYMHQNTNLVGANDNEQTGYLNITYAFNEWGKGCKARMPMARVGKIHMLNNYYNCAGNATNCINPRRNSEFLIEGNYFEKKVYRYYGQRDAVAVTWGKDNFVSERHGQDVPQSFGETVTVPYKYKVVKSSVIPAEVGNNAGATLFTNASKK